MASRELSPTTSGVRSGEASAFTLDTSGAVGPLFYERGEQRVPGFNLADRQSSHVVWPDLSPFAQGYVEAMFAAMRAWDGRPCTLPSPGGGVAIGLAFSDLAPETLAAILKDCEAGRNLSSGLVPTFRKNKLGGAAFWRQREGYGFPPLTPALNDAGRVVFA
jgi:hypothetical protein